MFQPHDPPWCRPAGHIAQSIVGVVEIVIQRGSCDGIADGGHLGGSLGVGDIPVQVLPSQGTHGNRTEPPQGIIAEVQGVAQSRGHRFSYNLSIQENHLIFNRITKKPPESEDSGVKIYNTPIDFK